MVNKKDGTRKRHIIGGLALSALITGVCAFTWVTVLPAEAGAVSEAVTGKAVPVSEAADAKTDEAVAASEDTDKATGRKLSKEQEIALNEVRDVYNVSAQSEIASQLKDMKKEKDYMLDNMLIKYNPFGTNAQSAYAYFTTERAVKVSYTVSVSDKSVSDFTQEVKQKKEYQKEHEFQVLGLIPDIENKVRFTITDEDGNEMSKVFAYNMVSLLGDESVRLKTDAKIPDGDGLTEGLYAVMRNEENGLNFIHLYDNGGVLRGEIPLLGESDRRMLIDKDAVYYSISDTEIAAISPIGQVIAVYDTGTYEVRHDYIFDEDGNILMLATDSTQDSVEDVIIKLDIASGQVTELLDLGAILGNYKASCVKNAEGRLDWLKLNSIQLMGNGQILLSSGETSTILKVVDLYGSPRLEYMLGKDDFWKGTEYEKLLFTKEGDFTIQGSQNSVVYVEDKLLKEGQYYLYMFNNNVGNSPSRPDFDWGQAELKKSSVIKGRTSYFYKYIVDEKNRSFRLADSFKVPYSESAGSAQELKGNVIISSGLTGVFEEYDEKHNLITRFKLDADKGINRVYKYGQ